jgi:REP element-mobilizing transposase RayT
VGRALRIQEVGGIFHVTARGVRRGVVFVDEFDYQLYLRLLERTLRRDRWAIHAYCLMPNHVHLLVRLRESTLSVGVHRLHCAYARRFNGRHGFAGHAFDARFSSTLIAGEAHHFEALRYIALNPVRAGLCDEPEDWQWSSYPAVAGHVRGGSLVVVGEVRELFGGDRNGARRYRQFVDDGRRAVA